ncbi:MAG: hypothetical protein U5L04_16805 [Trueperaceae bacterium]|nr:hypothetical protein [Trueperaceae bacterium]
MTTTDQPSASATPDPTARNAPNADDNKTHDQSHEADRHEADRREAKPDVVIGWVLAADVRDAGLLEVYEQTRQRLQALLREQFPDFAWRLEPLERRTFTTRGTLKPLDLLELGVEEKLHRRWDFALVVVPNELAPRKRIFAMGVPSSALEVAVLSSARMEHDAALSERLTALALHLLGHLFGLEHTGAGPMTPPDIEGLEPTPFSADQQSLVHNRLDDIADPRLEELHTRWNAPIFYWRSFWNDPKSIAKSVWNYGPWRIPLYLGRMTAAVIASLLVLLLTAETWEAGSNVATPDLVFGVTLSIIIATLFVFFGQHLDQVGRGRGWSEQLARSRIVILGTLLIGMVFLWVVLFVLLLLVSFALPTEVTTGWAGAVPGELPRLRYVSFMSSIGILAAALGGNLEEEDTIKAELFFDEET